MKVRRIAFVMKIMQLLLMAPVFAAHLALAQSSNPVKRVEAAHTDSAGLALKGYDPVAYFTASKAVKGDPSIQEQHQGVTYRFSSNENRDSFRKQPERYLPQYGGYCAWAVGHNYTAPADPEAWKIINGKLYLNYNKDVQKKWVAEEAPLISAGDKNWPGLHK
jgi:YHS domain-containing protein